MAKQEVKLNPGHCLRNLKEYQDRVIGLVTYVDAILEFVPDHIRKTLQKNNEAVKEFISVE